MNRHTHSSDVAGRAARGLAGLLLFCLLAAAAMAQPAPQSPPRQAARFVQHGFSFQPPDGWRKDPEAQGGVVVQYLGPERPDRTRPALNLDVNESVLSLGDPEINALAARLSSNLNEQGMRGVEVTARQAARVGNFDALQLDLNYLDGEAPMRLRQVYIPVAPHNSTYLFTFVDTQSGFAESAAAAMAAVNSFAPEIPRAPEAAAAEAGESNGSWLLIILGLVALAVVIGAAYLLLTRRTATT